MLLLKIEEIDSVVIAIVHNRLVFIYDDIVGILTSQTPCLRNHLPASTRRCGFLTVSNAVVSRVSCGNTHGTSSKERKISNR
jgi:hypothetical protein